MNLSRRGFLTGIIAACAAPAIIRTPGLIMPVKPLAEVIALSPKEPFVAVRGLLTPIEITREALRILHQKISFIASIDCAYDESFARISDSLVIRRPAQFALGALHA